MATLPATNPTLIDWAKLRDPKGNITGDAARLLDRTDELVDDMVYMEANGDTHHRLMMDSSLPSVSARSFNQGTMPTKGTQVQVDEQMAMFEARTQVDAALANLGGQREQVLMAEARKKVSAMHQRIFQALVYDNAAATPASINGLHLRCSLPTGAVNSQNVFDAGGSGSTNTSILLVGWGEDTVFGIFPKGMAAGLQRIDYGERTVYTHDAAGNITGQMEAYESVYKWNLGLAVKDWQFVARCGSIPAADAATLSNFFSPSGTNTVIHVLDQMLNCFPYHDGIRPAFYMNRTIYGGLRRMCMEKSTNALSLEQGVSQFGTPRTWLSYLGVPIRRCDGLLNTEAAI